MAITRGFTKSGAEVLDYAINWETWLDGDTISSSVWDVDTGLTEDSESETSSVATVWLSGGTDNEIYQVTNQIVTAGGRTAERSFRLTIEDR